MVFQYFNLWLPMTLVENILEATVHVLRENRAEAVEQAHAILKKVGLSDKHTDSPAQLSGGQQQRAAIARTLAMCPKVILFDEPTSALGPEPLGEVRKVKGTSLASTITVLEIPGYAKRLMRHTVPAA